MSDKGSISSNKSAAGSITEYLRGLKFKKRIFGGVDEADVWKKIEELNELYEKLLLVKAEGTHDDVEIKRD